MEEMKATSKVFILNPVVGVSFMSRPVSFTNVTLVLQVYVIRQSFFHMLLFHFSLSQLLDQVEWRAGQQLKSFWKPSLQVLLCLPCLWIGHGLYFCLLYHICTHFKCLFRLVTMCRCKGSEKNWIMCVCTYFSRIHILVPVALK